MYQCLNSHTPHLRNCETEKSYMGTREQRSSGSSASKSSGCRPAHRPRQPSAWPVFGTSLLCHLTDTKPQPEILLPSCCQFTLNNDAFSFASVRNIPRENDFYPRAKSVLQTAALPLGYPAESYYQSRFAGFPPFLFCFSLPIVANFREQRECRRMSGR
jgi:hypothetical protein